MRYRVNYGNGQVWEPRDPNDLRACEVEAKASPAGARVEFYEPGSADCPGDWFQVRWTSKPH